MVGKLTKISTEDIRRRLLIADENGWLGYSAGFLLAVAVGLYTTWELIGSNGLDLLHLSRKATDKCPVTYLENA